MRSHFRAWVLGICCCTSISAMALSWGQKSLKVPEFSAVHSQYINDIEIIGGGESNSVIVSGNPVLFKYVKTSVNNGMLNIKAPRGVHVLIHAADLHQVNVVGQGHVEAKGLDVLGPFSIHLAGSVDMSLTGPVDLSNVVVSGKTSVNAQWVDAKDLKVYSSGGAKVALSGRSQNSYFASYDDSEIDARWLRAKEVTVQTADKSLAKVLPVDGLTAYAIASSRVEYFKRPKRYTPFSSKSGNVLLAGEVE